MKLIKTFCPAVLAALIAMAFAGTASVMAESTALCLEDLGPGSAEACPADQLVTHVHETSVGNAALLTGVFNVECSALFSGDVKSPGGSGAPLVIEGIFTYSGCTTGCVVTEESVPTEIEVLKRGRDETADVITYSLVRVDCPGFVNCTFKRAGMQGIGKDPSSSKQQNGELSFDEQAVDKESGALCLDKAKLDVVTTPLNKTYITN